MQSVKERMAAFLMNRYYFTGLCLVIILFSVSLIIIGDKFNVPTIGMIGIISFIVSLFTLAIGLLVIRDIKRSKDAPNELSCPYCDEKLRSDVRHLGQFVVCPQCHGQVQMPLSPTQKMNQQIGVVIGLILGALLISGGIIKLMIGGVIR